MIHSHWTILQLTPVCTCIVKNCLKRKRVHWLLTPEELPWIVWINVNLDFASKRVQDVLLMFKGLKGKQVDFHGLYAMEFVFLLLDLPKAKNNKSAMHGI